MIGFLTLTTSSITPIIEFGYFAAIGVFFSFILSMTVMPAMLVLFRAPKIAHNVERKNSWEAPLGRFYDKLIASRGKTIVVFSLLLIASSIGVFLIRANNYIIEDLKDDHPMKVDYR
jgi:predicted RND superfamily exporter protein